MADAWIDVDTAVAVPVNKAPLIDDTDFKTREVALTYDQAGMDLVWNFVTSAGVMTQTAVTPTTAGDYDWTHVGDGMYKIEIPASAGASINNDTEGYGWFSGICTGVLPWISPIYGFRAAGLNDLLVDSAFSATRGLAGTALPAAAADGAGGVPISDAGGLDLDSQIKTDIDAILGDTNELQVNQGAWLTATGFSTHNAAAVWAVGTRTLTSFGTLASDVATAVWAAGTRTLSSFGTLVADTVAAVFAKVGLTVGGAVTFGGIVKALYAFARGKIVKTGDVYVYKDDDDTTTVFTNTAGTSTRTPS